jgi:hypothetical protein
LPEPLFLRIPLDPMASSVRALYFGSPLPLVSLRCCYLLADLQNE